LDVQCELLGFTAGTILIKKGEVAMRITQNIREIKSNQVLDVSVDVHKEILNFFFSLNGKEYRDECSNRTRNIEKRLQNYHCIAGEQGFSRLRLICEPTGLYQNKLLRTARRQGHLTCLVSTESVSKFRVIETNDANKTDIKDPRVIASLGQLNKVITHRVLKEDYLILRKLGRTYDDLDSEITSLRCRIDRLLIELFCDYSFKKDFLYGHSGDALLDQFGCNPYRIIDAGYEAFESQMKAVVPRIRRETLKRLWQDAESSVLNELPSGYVDMLEDHFRDLFSEHRQRVIRKKTVILQMTEILKRLRDDDPRIPPPTAGVISDKNLARLLGETGPLSDFQSWRQLMRYGGLNIRMRQSGKYEGRNRISKKGNPLLRKVLNHIVLPLVRQGSLYGEYYYKKRETEKMPGTKAMTVVSRHFLRKFYGWYKSGSAFDEKRFFMCEAEYLKAA
jgi:transposase